MPASTPSSFCVRLDPNAPPPLAKIGGKARSLLRLAGAGLRVPPAIVVTTDLFAALRTGGPPLPADLETKDALAAVEQAVRALAAAPWPAAFAATLAREIDTLLPDPGARFSVRSSAAIEDDAAALAAGLFVSCVDISRGEVLESVRTVLGSALSPAVVAYLAHHGLGSDALGFAVLIHPFVVSDASGAAAVDPGAATAGGTVPVTIEVHDGSPRALAGEPRRALERAARQLGGTFGASEIEWALAQRDEDDDEDDEDDEIDGDAGGGRRSTRGPLTFLQLRPYRRGARAEAERVGGVRLTESGNYRETRVAPAALEADDWRWDAAHNPLPLSPAQAGLVGVVEERCKIGLHQRVVGGYLFYSTDPTAQTAPIGATDALRALSATAEERLARPNPTLDDALETFVSTYQPLFGVVQPNARAARGALAAFLQRSGFDPRPLLPKLLAGVASAASERARRARELARAVEPAVRATALKGYLDEFGDESPRWDVAAPTWRETPGALERLVRGAKLGAPVDTEEWRAAAAAVRARLSPEAFEEWDARLSIARAAVAVAEDDDALYARLQAHVRRALLNEGTRLWQRGVLAAPDEVFWLALDSVRRDARGEIQIGYQEAALAVTAARAADVEARANPPPIGAAERSEEVGTDVVRGSPGAPGARIGRVRIYRGDEDHHQEQDQVLVARTILPTELPLLAPAAIVVETGGVLDHVAAQARERGIPAVVGAAGACRVLRNGDQVLVDGAAGLVIRLGS